MVSTFYHFPLENTPGNVREKSGDISRESPGKFPGKVRGSFPGKSGEISRESPGKRPKSVQPLVAADVMPARVHAVRARDYDRLRRARLTTLAVLWNCFGPLGRLGLPSSRPELYATLLATERENPRAGRKSPGATLPAS